MKVVYKYALKKLHPHAQTWEVQTIKLPVGAKILTAQLQPSRDLVVYALHSVDSKPEVERAIYVFQTGEYMESNLVLVHLATVVDPATGVVSHVFSDY